MTKGCQQFGKGTYHIRYSEEEQSAEKSIKCLPQRKADFWECNWTHCLKDDAGVLYPFVKFW